MNQKSLIRIVLALVVAAVGAWQYYTGQPNQNQKHHASKHQEHQRGGRSGNDHGQHQAQSQQTGDFDYYLVSLSWSPAYCSTHAQDKTQCGGRGFGFVLHGLWPQKSSGGYPENCPQTSEPSRTMVQKTLAFMPSEKLIHHEWTKHGTCSGLSGDQYLQLADQAFASIKIPTAFQAPATTTEMSASQIIAAFAQANTTLSEDSLSLRCSKGELDEVRVCVDTQLKPKACGKGIRTQCGKDAVQVRAVR
jgi:ribonuclease T2